MFVSTSWQCATVSLLDILASLEASQGLQYQVVAIDPIESRRTKMEAVYKAIDRSGKGSGRFAVASIEDGKNLSAQWTNGAGCNAVLEVSLTPYPSELRHRANMHAGRREQQRAHARI